MWRPKSLFWMALVAGIGLMTLAEAQLHYPTSNGPTQVRAVQLWYNGFWQHPGWINGTLVAGHRDNQAPIEGNIVAVMGEFAPYEKVIRKYMTLGAKAILILRDRGGTPGQGMYLIDGSDQNSIIVPVVEVYQYQNSKLSLHNELMGHLQTGISVQIWAEENAWKRCNENRFQVVWNVILSGMEIAVLILAFKRLHEWWEAPRVSIMSIGPICIILEVVSTLIRLSFTIVDPFWSYRMLPDLAAQIILTAHLPFMFTSGILLTFFWAETLLSTRIKVSPFISEYKKSAFFVIALLFGLEIACTTARLLVPVTAFNPGYLVQVFYVLVALTLTICYLICAVKLSRRVRAISKRKVYVRQMTLRFSISTSGYIIVIIMTVLSVAFISNPWGWKILSNGLFFGCNIAALLQVYSFRPPSASLATTTSSNGTSGSYQDSKLPAGTRHLSSKRASAGPPAHSTSMANLSFHSQRPVNEYESTEEPVPSPRDDMETKEEESSEYEPKSDHQTLIQSARRHHDSLETTEDESNLSGASSMKDNTRMAYSPSGRNSHNHDDDNDSQTPQSQLHSESSTDDSDV